MPWGQGPAVQHQSVGAGGPWGPLAALLEVATAGQARPGGGWKEQESQRQGRLQPALWLKLDN